MNKKSLGFFVIILVTIGMTFFTLGCGGKGHVAASVPNESTPEGAFRNLMDEWQANGVELQLTPSGELVATSTQAVEGSKIITFHDLSGNILSLVIKEITYISDERAQVHAISLQRSF
ncbi:hypothetical protein HYY75_11645 [bacterium]|nr:hypothetical protein [bacterium]